MGPLTWLSKPEFRNPVVIAAFGGWGDAQEGATGAARFVIHALEATKFAEIDSEDFYVFTRMRPVTLLDDKGKRFIQWPVNEFYYWKNPRGESDIIIFAGQEPQIKWKTYANLLVEFMETIQAKKVLMMGSFLDNTPHTRVSQVSGSASTPHMRDLLGNAGVQGARQPRSYQGPTDISAAFAIACEAKGIEYGYMWGHAPHYLQISPNPKVTLSLVQRLLRIVPLPVSVDPLQKASVGFEMEVGKALAGNAELQGYVAKLEQEYDHGARSQEPEFPTRGGAQPHEELPSSDAVLKDLEDFFRKRQPGDQGQPPGN